MDLLRREVRRAGKPIDLQPREFQLLEFLLRHAGQVVTRTMLLERRVGLPLRSADQRHRRAHQPAALEDRQGLRAAAAAHGARRRLPARRLRRARRMRLPRLFRTNVFRLTLAYMALFALSVGALSAFIYWATLGYLDTQTNAIIEAEITGLASNTSAAASAASATCIDERVARDAGGPLVLSARRPDRPAARRQRVRCPRGPRASTTRAANGSTSCRPTATRPCARCCCPSARLSAARRPRHPRAHGDPASAAPTRRSTASR